MPKVKLKDLDTGVECWYPDDDINVFQWTENNWGCDCNRRIAFFGKCDFDSPCESKRYVVVDAIGDLEGYSKDEFILHCNRSYQ